MNWNEFFRLVIENKYFPIVCLTSFYVASILTFGFIYFRIHSNSLSAIVKFKGRTLNGFTRPLHAFSFSDVFRNKIITKIKNDLRISEFFGDDNNVVWQSFTRGRVFNFARTDESERKQWDEHFDMSLRGISACDMVDNIFPKYPLITFVIRKYSDNYLHHTLPLSVVAHTYGEPISKIDAEFRNGVLPADKARLWQTTSEIAIDLKNTIFKDENHIKLFFLKRILDQYLDKLKPVGEQLINLKEIFLSEILATLAMPSTQLEVDYSAIKIEPDKWDFYYLSIVAGTCNIPSEITPVSHLSRALVGLQLILSFVILGVLVGIVAGLLS